MKNQLLTNLNHIQKHYLLFLIFSIVTFNAFSQLTIGSTTVDTTTIASNLNTPWDIIYTQDSSIWFTERVGKVSRIDLQTNQTHLLLDYQNQVESIHESGMLGMVILETTAIPKVFIVYTYRDSSNNFYERLSRFDYDLNQDTLINETVFIDSIPASNVHLGSRLVIINFQLYMTVGDLGIASYSQNLNSRGGKILRFELNGSVPNDNPIPGSFIYSWGHRNPQGLYYANNLLYSSEHGPSTDDEINIIEKGRNYGWPDVSGFCDQPSETTFCNDSNVVEPIFAWTPTVATAGICYYDHPAIPEWQGNLLLATLKGSRIINLRLNSTKDSVLGTTDHFSGVYGRLRDIETNQWGEVFIATHSTPHRIVKIHNPNLTSINEINQESLRVVVWPNPVKSELLVKAKGTSIKNASLQLFTINGQEIFNEPFSGNETSIDMRNFSQGVYLLKLTTDSDLTLIKKVIVE